MKSFEFSKKRIQSIWIVIFLLVIITIGIIIGCGKLTEDESPGSPVGTSGGTIALPIGPQSSWGTYSLLVWAHPPIIPADGVSYAIVKAVIEDTAGRSLENFLISFNTTSSDTVCQFMLPPNQPGGASSFSPTIQGLTGEKGKVSVFLYGMQGGSCVVQATIDIDEDGSEDLFDTTTLVVSGGPGVPGPDLPGVYLTADNTYKSENVGTCGENSTEIEFELYADVWDQTGVKVGAGVRVEFYEAGVLIGWAETGGSGTATATVSSGTLFPPTVPSSSRTITAEVDIAGEIYTDTITLTALATCEAATPVPTATPTVVTLTLNAAPNPIPAAQDWSTITILATIGGSPAPAGINIQVSTTLGGFSLTPPPDGPNSVTVTTGAGGIATTQLNYSGGAGIATVISSVTSAGYSGASTPFTVTFQ